MKFEHIIWDWNGTLLDDAWLCHEVSNLQLNRYGVPLITLEQYRDLVCHPARDFFARCGVNLNEKEFAEVGRLFHIDYNELRSRCSLQAGAIDLISSLKTRTLTQSVLSAHPHQMLVDALSHYKLLEHFDHIVGHHNEVADSKVDNGRALLAKIGGSSTNTVLIGDSDHDAEVADELGIECFLISHGLQSRSRLVPLNKPIFESLEQLSNELLRDL